jgi:alpha-L-arabinofuranosidase
VEQRKAQRNIWGYHQTSGLGYFEYFQFCEDIGAKPLPVFPAAVSCQNSGNTWPIGGTGQRALPIDELNEYIQEVLDLIEWANADANTTWGAKRAAAGHPKPFNLEYVGIGNEDKMSPAFEERFNLIYTAVKAKHPEITVVGTVGPAPSGEDFEIGWKIANKLKVPIVDEHYYMQADWFLHNQYRYDSYPRTASKVYLGEYASWGNKMHNAIAEAAYLTGIERNGDIVQMASYAPLLAKKGFTQWTTDLIFFDNTTLCPTPNYFVQKLFMTNQGDRYFDGIVQKADRDSTLAASCVVESSTGDLILKLVNASIEPKTVKIDLSKFKNLREKARISVLVGKAEAMNTFDAPKTIRPTESDLKISKKMDYSTPAMSLTVIRVKMKK